jgi:hypothetical protein
LLPHLRMNRLKLQRKLAGINIAASVAKHRNSISV